MSRSWWPHLNCYPPCLLDGCPSLTAPSAGPLPLETQADPRGGVQHNLTHHPEGSWGRKDYSIQTRDHEKLHVLEGGRGPGSVPTFHSHWGSSQSQFPHLWNDSARMSQVRGGPAAESVGDGGGGL